MAGIVFAELLIKSKIEKRPELQNKKLFKDKIVINSLYNYGISFGNLSNKPEVIKIILSFFLGIGLIIYIFMLCFKKISGVTKPAFAFILGGGISNLIDRYRRGFVFDYFSFVSKKHRKISNMVFNLADIFIFVGGALYLLKYLRSKGD